MFISMTTEETPGDRVRALRKRDKLTQGQLADLVKCTTSTISRIESNENEGDDILSQIATHFKVSFEWVKTGIGTKPKGLVVMTVKKNAEQDVYRDALVQELKDEVLFYRELLRNLTGKAPGNFLQALTKAGVPKVVSMHAYRQGARVGARA